MRSPEEFLNPKIAKFTPYSLNSGVDLSKIKIRLDANETFSSLPYFLLEEIRGLLREVDFNRYPDPNASALIQKFADYLKAGEDADVDAANIVAGNGSDELLNVIINLFLSKGDKMLVFEPDFSMYAFYGDIIEAQVVRVQKRKTDLKIDWKKAGDLIKGGDIKLAVFSNPCNPTGQLEAKDDVRRFIELARDNGAVVILDEVYMDFCEGRESFLKHNGFLEYPNVFIIKSLSKSIGLASLRVGFAISNPAFVNAVRTVKSPFNVNAVSQKIAETVLSYPEYLSERLQIIKKNKAELQSKLDNIFEACTGYKIRPTETNFILIESQKAADINKMFRHLLRNKILVRNLGKYLRITSGSAEENAELSACLAKYVSNVSNRKVLE